MIPTYKSIEEESQELAKIFIVHFIETFDFTPYSDKLAQDIDNYVFTGNWDHTVDFDIEGVPRIRIIQEDEYDQSMDEDDEDTPKWDDVDYVGGYYVMLVK